MTLYLPGKNISEMSAELNARADLRLITELKLGTRGFWGPHPYELLKYIPEDLKGVNFTDKPWAENKTGYLNNKTIWVPNPNDRDVGIWALTATGEHNVRAAIEAGDATVYGYYVRVLVGMPRPFSKVEFLTFQDGFLDAFYRYYPDQRPKAPPPEKRPAPPMPTYELTVYGPDNTEIWVAKTEAESGADEPGNPHPGVSLAGPGKWEELVGGELPGAHGLTRRLLAYDESTGVTAPATTEYTSVLEAARKGNPGARSALDYLGIRY